jgi:hypothetical protein
MSGLRLQVFDPTNTTFLGELTAASEVEFVDEFNGPGFGTIVVPLTHPDADLLERDRVVRMLYEGVTRFSWVVETIDRTLVEASGQTRARVSGRGILCWLEDAIVYPQAGLRETFVGDRPFNFAAEGGPWTNSGNFTNAQGVRWRNDSTSRSGLPRRWPDASAFWIWKTDPTAKNVSQGTVNWMRRTFTLAARTRVTFFASADNFFELYLNGQQIMSSSRFTEQSPSFAQMTRYSVTLGVGEHLLAARVRNGKPWRREDIRASASNNKISASNHGLTDGTQIRFRDIEESGTNLSNSVTYFVRDVEPNAFRVATSAGGTAVNIAKDTSLTAVLFQDEYAGFILVGLKTQDDGKPDKSSAPVVRTNLSWQVSDEEPLWRPAMILRTLMQEATDRSVYRFSKFSYSFNTSSPTSGTWSTYADVTLKVGSTLLQVHDEMVDLGVDFWINPVTCQLSSAERRGVDKSATVQLQVARNLMSYETSVERKLKTAALIQYKDGWTQAANNQGSLGRRETYLEMGRTRSNSTAQTRARRFLARTGKQTILASTVDAVVVPGCVPYVDFTVGDVIGIPGPLGTGTRRARVVSLAMKDDQGTARFMPELEVL